MKIITRCGQKAEPDLHLSNLVGRGAFKGVIPALYVSSELIFDVRYDDKSGWYTILYLYPSNTTIAMRTTVENWKVSWAIPVFIEEVIVSHNG